MQDAELHYCGVLEMVVLQGTQIQSRAIRIGWIKCLLSTPRRRLQQVPYRVHRLWVPHGIADGCNMRERCGRTPVWMDANVARAIYVALHQDNGRSFLHSSMVTVLTQCCGLQHPSQLPEPEA